MITTQIKREKDKYLIIQTASENGEVVGRIQKQLDINVLSEKSRDSLLKMEVNTFVTVNNGKDLR